MTTRTTMVQHLIPHAQAPQYQSLTGQPVTASWLNRSGAVVMADAVSSLTSLLPQYEVISVDIQPHSETYARAIITYRPRVVICDVCQQPYVGMPQTIHFDGSYRIACWCSDACKQQLIQAHMAEVARMREEVGDIVKASMQYLRLRQAVPKSLRAIMTNDEWDTVRRQCSQEYTQAQRGLLTVLVAHIGSAHHLPTRQEAAFQPVQAEPVPLFELEGVA